MKIETVTAQQEQAYKEYKKAVNECSYYNVDFIDFYRNWCLENGYCNDDESLLKIED